MDNFKISRRIIANTFEAFMLDWDTDYFNVMSAKAILKDLIPVNERKELMEFFKEFDFITINNTRNNWHNNVWLAQETSAFLTDMNIQFQKSLIKSETTINNVEPEICHKYEGDESILNIARRGFKYSRFFNDPYLDHDRVQEIYVQWTQNAFNKQGQYFSIANVQGEIAGFLLFTITSENCAVIELIAVSEYYRGRNVGKSLIQSMERYLCMKDINLIQVGTQVDNVNAVRFYSSCGFSYSSCNAIYHFWP